MNDPSTTGAIRALGGFVPEHALAFADASGAAVPVGAANPLPIATTLAASGATPLSGSTSASGSFGPYAPVLGRAIMLTLAGTWSGTVQVLRSVDGGATKLPLTAGGQPWASFTANANEAIAEEGEAGASYWLAVTLTSGTLAYRVAQ